MVEVEYCHYCDHDQYPRGKILWNDKYAEKTERGDWKCGECVTTDHRKSLVRSIGPDAKQTAWFIEEEKRNVSKHNAMVKEVNQVTGINRLKPRKNRYDDDIKKWKTSQYTIFSFLQVDRF
jgi:hypothetical protein